MDAMLKLGGIYPPVPAFFGPDEGLDLATLRRHVAWLCTEGIEGIVVLGSNGEAVHLDEAERGPVIAAVREAAGADAQVLAGVGALSTRATLANCRVAAQAGADVALVLPPAHYRGAMTATALRGHYLAVADASPLPIAIYNMPANTAGVELDAETRGPLSAPPQIIGFKGNLGKLSTSLQ